MLLVVKSLGESAVAKSFKPHLEILYSFRSSKERKKFRRTKRNKVG